MADTTEANSSLSEAEQFLKTLDLPPDEDQAEGPTSGADAGGAGATANASDIMSFLDEIANTTNNTYEPTETEESPTKRDELKPILSDSWRQWGASIWNQANEAVKSTSEQINQATTNPDTAKALQDRVKGLQAFISSDNVTKLGEEKYIRTMCDARQYMVVPLTHCHRPQLENSDSGIPQHHFG